MQMLIHLQKQVSIGWHGKVGVPLISRLILIYIATAFFLFLQWIQRILSKSSSMNQIKYV